jgi:hypothetical protein
MFREHNDNWHYVLKRNGIMVSLKKAHMYRNMLEKLIEYFVLFKNVHLVGK